MPTIAVKDQCHYKRCGINVTGVWGDEGAGDQVIAVNADHSRPTQDQPQQSALPAHCRDMAGWASEEGGVGVTGQAYSVCINIVELAFTALLVELELCLRKLLIVAILACRELRKKLEPEMLDLIKQQRLNFLMNGTHFPLPKTRTNGELNAFLIIIIQITMFAHHTRVCLLLTVWLQPSTCSVDWRPTTKLCVTATVMTPQIIHTKISQTNVRMT